jgi:hypothetical protein
VRRLLATPATAALVTAGEERYVLARSVLLRVSGPGIIPGCARIFTGLDDGTYALRAAAGPQRDPARRPPAAAAVRDMLGRLRSVAAWQPVTATRWALINGPRDGRAQVLARRDADGMSRATAVSAVLWQRWHAAFREDGWTLRAWQQDGRPARPLKMDVFSAHAGTWTAATSCPSRSATPCCVTPATWSARPPRHRPVPASLPATLYPRCLLEDERAVMPCEHPVRRRSRSTPATTRP